MDATSVSEILNRPKSDVLTTDELAAYFKVSKRFIEMTRADGSLGISWRKRGRDRICDRSDADRVMPGGANHWCAPKQASALTGLSTRTLEKDRATGRERFAWLRLGQRLIRYRKADLSTVRRADRRPSSSTEVGS